MKMHLCCLLATIGLALIAADSASAVDYKATILHPLSGFQTSFGQGLYGNSQVGYGRDTANGVARALLWNGTAESVVNLHPSEFHESWALGAAGSTQVGHGYGKYNSSNHRALMWTGTAASAIDLHPNAVLGESQAHGVSGDFQIGWATNSIGLQHATLWNGSAASAVDLHPAGFVYSFAWGVSGSRQVGSGLKVGEDVHALLWNGTAASVVDLNPAGFTYSVAGAVSENSQVGTGYGPATGGTNIYHALLWHGSAASVVDLHPSGFFTSRALGVAGSHQVGWGNGTATGFQDHALLWNGMAEGVVDLHPYLASLPQSLVHSSAHGIDENGAIVGFARDSDNRAYAVLWSPIPEPSACALFCFGMMGAVLFRRRPRPQRF